MSKKNVYKTIGARSETLLVEKKSKFITNAAPIRDETEALEFLGEIRSKYPDATHNVYAYVIDENNIFRYSDDGEPSGTAGMPVLDSIRKSGIVDAAVVVTRYFGGTLLGTGGLVHTYGASARRGLEAAGIVLRRMCDVLAVHTPYDLLGKVRRRITSTDCILEDIIYEDEVKLIISSPTDMTGEFTADITNLTNARAACEIIDKKYTDTEARD